MNKIIRVKETVPSHRTAKEAVRDYSKCLETYFPGESHSLPRKFTGAFRVRFIRTDGRVVTRRCLVKVRDCCPGGYDQEAEEYVPGYIVFG